MGKDSNFTGQPVYSQVLKILDREKFTQISRETAIVRDELLPLETIDLSSSRSFSVSLTTYFRFGIAEFK